MIQVTVADAPATTAEASPAATGGEGPARPRASGPPRFADRADGTLLDTRAGLTWTTRPSESALAWKASKGYCRKLELGRQEDWMLPTIEELEELHRAGSGAPGSAALTFPVSLAWSASKSGSGKAWAFDFSQGQRAEQALAGDGATVKALCVRRDQPQRRPQLQGFEPPDLGGGVGGQPPPRGGGGAQPPPRGGGGGQGPGGPGNAQGNSQDGGGGGQGSKKGGKPGGG
ncbi:MAG: DUF1566 domain-containing protein [bacterium]|nr:DUF1566 domain-containing protein [bacterium]